MKNYTLLLDESGEFKEGEKIASFVAGILLEKDMEADQLTAEWAKDYFSRVKHSCAKYRSININPFHGMEERSPYVGAFMADLLCNLAADGAIIVSFKNEKGRMIVDGDTTYLNVLAEGVVTLIRELLKQTSGEISLHVFYARRINVEELERSNKKNYIPIEESEYDKRIQERLELLIAKLSTVEQTRIGKRVTLSRDIATQNHLLMLADAVCSVLYNHMSRLKSEQKMRIRALPYLSFPVLEKETWETIQDCILQNHYAEAIFLWYGGYRKDLHRYEAEFHRQLVQHFSGADAAEQEIDTAILSQYLQQLVRRGNYALARQYIRGMETDFFPLMRGNSIALERLYFDVHFHGLTIATHEGRSKEESEEIETCREGLRLLPSTYETLDYYLKYKLREVEHWKNSYDFRQAASDLEKLVNILTGMMNLTQAIDDLDGFAEGMTSDTLGRVYGSLTMTRCFLGLAAPEQFAEARAAFEKSVRQFSREVDRQRAYQNRAAVEYWSGQYGEAMAFLALAFKGEKTSNSREVLDAILQEGNLVTRKFGLMHYTSIMARAMLAGHPIGDRLMEAWQETFPVYEEENASHPAYLILWRVASCFALQDKKMHAKEYYERAIDAAMSQKASFPNLAAGLVMQLDRIALCPGGSVQEHIDRLKKDFEDFTEAEIPVAMRDWFTPWQELLDRLDGKTVAERKPEILRLVSSMPIL